MTRTDILYRNYDLLIDTLIMSCPIIGSTTDDEIDEYLEELEGDYYTFFDRIFLIDLYNAGLLNEAQLVQIEEIKIKINNLDRSLWNKESVKVNCQWKEISENSNKILDSLLIKKR